MPAAFRKLNPHVAMFAVLNERGDNLTVYIEGQHENTVASIMFADHNLMISHATPDELVVHLAKHLGYRIEKEN